MKFEVGKTYSAKNNNSFKVVIVSRTKCFVVVKTVIDGTEDKFMGLTRYKTEMLRGFEYFCSTLFQYQADNFEVAPKI